MDLHRWQGQAIALQITGLTTHFNERNGFHELLPRRIKLRTCGYRGRGALDACAGALDVWRRAFARGIRSRDRARSHFAAMGRAAGRGWRTDLVAMWSGHLPGIDLFVGRRTNVAVA